MVCDLFKACFSSSESRTYSYCPKVGTRKANKLLDLSVACMGRYRKRGSTKVTRGPCCVSKGQVSEYEKHPSALPQGYILCCKGTSSSSSDNNATSSSSVLSTDDSRDVDKSLMSSWRRQSNRRFSCRSVSQLGQSGLRGRIGLQISVQDRTLCVYIGSVQDVRLPAKDSQSGFYVQVSINSVSSDKRSIYVSQLVMKNSPTFDEMFYIPVTRAGTHQRLLVEVYQVADNGEGKLVGCTSFGVKHLLNRTKSIEGNFFLLSAAVGASKHLPADGTQVYPSDHLVINRYSIHRRCQSTPKPSSCSRSRPPCVDISWTFHYDLSLLSEETIRGSDNNSSADFDLLHISDDDDLDPRSSFRPSHRTSPRSHIRQLLGEAELPSSTFFATTGYFSDSLQEVRAGDSMPQRHSRVFSSPDEQSNGSTSSDIICNSVNNVNVSSTTLTPANVDAICLKPGHDLLKHRYYIDVWFIEARTL